MVATHGGCSVPPVKWPARRPGRPMGTAMVLLLLVGVFAVATGSGFTAARSIYGDGGAWLSRGRSVVHVNAATGRTDAEVTTDLARRQGQGSELLEVVQGPDGGVYVVNTETNELTAIDPVTMAPRAGAPVTRPGANPGAVAVHVGDRGEVFVSDATSGTVAPVDPVTLAPIGDAPFTVEGTLAGATPHPDGGVWALDKQGGTLTHVDAGRPAAPLAVAPEGHQLLLTRVGGDPVIVDLTAGTVRRIDAETATLDDPIALGTGPGRLLVPNDPSAPGATAWLMAPGTGELVGVDLDAGTVRRARVGQDGAHYEAPVVHAGRVYVADASHHVVRAVEAGSLTVVGTHRPPGTSGRLELFVDDDTLWINDADHTEALMVDADGTERRIDKGTGNGVEEELEPPADRPIPEPVVEPAPQVSPPPAPVLPAPSPRPIDPVPAPLAAAPVAPSSSASLAPPTPAPRPPAPPPTRPPAAAPTAPDRPTPRNTTPEPAPEAPTEPATATVPSLVGSAVEQACNTTLPAAGLACGRADAGEGDPVNQVTAQDVPPGTTVAAGSTVTITYFGAPLPEIPVVIGADVHAACGMVEQAGFGCTKVFGDDPGNGPTNTVHAQSASGPAPRGTQVAVTYTVRRLVLTQLRARDLSTGNPMRIWYLTTNAAQADALVAQGKYTYDSVLGACYEGATPGTVPLQHFFYEFGDDHHRQHLFTTGAPDVAAANGRSWQPGAAPTCYVVPGAGGPNVRHRMGETTPPTGNVRSDGNGHVQTGDVTTYAGMGFVIRETYSLVN